MPLSTYLCIARTNLRMATACRRNGLSATAAVHVANAQYWIGQYWAAKPRS